MNNKRVREFIFSPLPIEDVNSVWIDTSQDYSFKIRYYKDGEWIPIETPITNEFQVLMQQYAAEVLVQMQQYDEFRILISNEIQTHKSAIEFLQHDVNNLQFADAVLEDAINLEEFNRENDVRDIRTSSIGTIAPTDPAPTEGNRKYRFDRDGVCNFMSNSIPGDTYFVEPIEVKKGDYCFVVEIIGEETPEYFRYYEPCASLYATLEYVGTIDLALDEIHTAMQSVITTMESL